MYLKVKRIIDFMTALAAIVVLSPLFLLIAAAVKLDDPGAVFFKQRRIGADGKLFDILKFRTMRANAPKDVPTHLLEDPESYITTVGRLLRKTSLDELPQLFNILKGDMSVVAPRPALWNQQDLFDERDKYKGRFGRSANQIRPGLTGWAQINGRDELPVPVKAELDGEYMRRISFVLDCKIFFMTFLCVITKRGVREGNANEAGSDYRGA